MANTTNLDLEKPLGTDKALVARLNSNSDKIDAWAGSTNQALSNKTDYLIIDATSYEYDTKAGWDYVYEQIPDNFNGVLKVRFNNYYIGVCTAYRQKSGWGSIIGHMNSNHIPFFYNVNSGTSTLDGLALKSEALPKSFTLAPGGSITLTRSSDIVLPFAYIITARASGSTSLGITMGIGYGQSDSRHKITSLINTSDSTFVADTNAFGLVVTNTSSSRTLTYNITALDNG